MLLSQAFQCSWNHWAVYQGWWPGEGTPIHYLYGYVPPNGVVILKLPIQNGVPISEAFSRMGYNISNAQKLQFCKQPFEIFQGQIAFKNTVQCVNKQTVVLLLHPRTECRKLAHFQNGVSVLGRLLERGINFRGNFFQNGVPIWSPGRHIPTQKIPKCPPRDCQFPFRWPPQRLSNCQIK